MSIVDDSLLAAGADALKSQFEVIFPSGIPGGGNGVAVSLRMDETFDPPEHGVQVYEIFKKGQKIPKPGGAEEVDKMFTVNVRLDQQWRVYDDLKRWMRLVYNEKTGTPGQSNNSRTTVEVVSLDENNIPVKTIQFQGVFISKIKIQEFDNQSADPSKLECTFHFARMVDGV